MKSWFRVLDARDYKDIATVELERPIFDLNVNSQSSLLSIVEGRQLITSDYEEDDSVCRVYDIGRKRLSEDDSDVEDDQDESDMLDEDEYDDESESDGGDDDDMDDDEDDSDVDDMESFGSNDESEEGVDESDAESGHSTELLTEYGEDEAVEDPDEDSEAQYESSLERSGLSGRDIRFLFEIPDVAYYDVHGQYSSEEDEVDEDE